MARTPTVDRTYERFLADLRAERERDDADASAHSRVCACVQCRTGQALPTPVLEGQPSRRAAAATTAVARVRRAALEEVWQRARQAVAVDAPPSRAELARVALAEYQP